MRNIHYILLLVLIPLGEVHWLFSHMEDRISPFVFSDVQIYPQWVVKNVAEMLQFCIVSYIAYCLSKYVPGISELRLILKGVFFFSMLDFTFYFLTYKHGYYGLVYLGVMVLIWYFKFGRKRRVV